jgi:rare lipoprotein A
MKKIAALAVLVFLAAACGPARRPPAAPAPPPVSAPAPGAWGEEGIASWYGEPFHGRKTANGETYDMEKMTAAHKTLPFNTVVRVTNLRNGRSADVRINDRGPFVKGRIIDLSRAAARSVDMVGDGTAPVRLSAVAHGAAPPGRAMTFAVQVGAFSVKANAEGLRLALAAHFGSVYVVEAGGFHRLRVGPFAAEDEARRAEERLRAMGHEGFVVAED